MNLRKIIQNKRTVIISLVVLLLYVSLFHWRYVCGEPQRLRTFLFFSYCFFLFTPCLYLLLDVLFSAFLRIFFFTYYLLLALFPYKILFPANTGLCTLYTDPSITLVFGLGRYWGLILYAFLSLGITLGWLWYHHRTWTKHIPREEIAICGFLLGLTVVQIVPRINENSLIKEGIHRNKELCGTSYTNDFFGHCAFSDQPHWTDPNGFFKGVHIPEYKLAKWSFQFLQNENLPESVVDRLKPLKWREFDDKEEFLAAVSDHIGKEATVQYQEQLLHASLNDSGYAKLVANRRGLSSYLYSLLEPFTHPYYALILVNVLFYYLLLLSGYTLAKWLKLPHTVITVYLLFLSIHPILYSNTTATVFYIQKYAFFFFILVVGYTREIYTKPISLTDKVLFCSVLACSALVYDPHIKVGFVFLWGLFYALSQFKDSRARATVTLLHAIGYAIVPLLALRGFKILLTSYNLAGKVSEHADAVSYLIAQIPAVPRFIVHHLWESVGKISDELTQIILYNPVSRESLKVMGVFGVVCFFSIFPKYIKGEYLKGFYATYLSSLIITLIAAFLAYIPPLKYPWLEWSGPTRTIGDVPVLVLAQSIGLYHSAEFVCRWLPTWLEPKYPTYLVVLFIFIFSYHRLLILY